jgi:hypothetical protein
MRIQHHRQIDELLLQTHIGDIGHPQLVDITQLQVLGQVRIHPKVVLRVRSDHKLPLPNGQQIVFSHQAPHLLGSHHQALPPQQHCDATIAIVPMRQGQPLHGAAQLHLRRGGFCFLPVAIEAGPTEA